MKNFDEYTQNIRNKAKKIKARRRAIAASCTAVFVLVLALTLFVPYSTQLPSVSKYQHSQYYKLINGLNKATYQPPAYQNNYEWLKSILSAAVKVAPPEDTNVSSGVVSNGGGSPVYGITPWNPAAEDKGDDYIEVTDNQVEGIIEGDLFKRSDKHIYYLRGNELTVYSIAGENSAKLARINVFPTDTKEAWFRQNTNLYLSADCKTLTVVGEGYSKDFGAFTAVTSVDVSNPEKPVCGELVCFTGSIISSRVVDGDLLLIYNYSIYQEIDFNNPETFVPIYGTLGDMQPIAPENIFCPAEDPTSACYTVIAKLDGETLQVQDTTALLSYSQQVYVSQDTVYATYGCTKMSEDGTLRVQITEITGISYLGDNLQLLGTATVNGRIENQYSMDQYNGILRVATSTVEMTGEGGTTGDTNWFILRDAKRNCDLYCIDLSTWEIAASVIGFAPDGEEVTSARFDGPAGYICTAEVVILTDPVYFFDLSDIHNITYKHTPIIDGYSSSLINFGNYLLGIGVGGDWNIGLKLEAYAESGDGVISLATYEREAIYSEEYKSYFIDRENNLIGLHVADSDSTGNRPYLLLHFDGYKFHEVQVILSDKTDTSLWNTRAFIADGYLYLLTAHKDGFIVTNLAG